MIAPVYNNSFYIGLDGVNSDPARRVNVAGCTTFEVGIDKKIAEWTPLQTGLQARRVVIGRSISVKIQATRVYGDPGNDYLASRAWASGTFGEHTDFIWIMPDGNKIMFSALVNVETFGGDATDVDMIDITIYSTGPIEFLPYLDNPIIDVEIGGLEYKTPGIQGFTVSMTPEVAPDTPPGTYTENIGGLNYDPLSISGFSDNLSIT